MLQEQALEVLTSGKNAFLTGAAGTGKTYLLKQFIEHLKDNEISYAVTASTGLAATHLDGVTIHSWSGIGVKTSVSKQDITNLKKNVKYNYRTTRVLIIDEISMLHAYHLDMIDKIARAVRNRDEPFGGMQVVFCGDFCQLPPVGNDVVFAYESKAWKNCNLTVCYLTEQYRQNDTDDLVNILNNIRDNSVTVSTRYKLRNLACREPLGHFVKLYTTNIDVDRINRIELAKMDGETHTFDMNEYGSPLLVGPLKKQCLAKERLELKVGAPVLFIQNDPNKKYVNGTLGEITRFNALGLPVVTTRSGRSINVDVGEWKVEDHKGKPIASITQLPLVLAWALTVHKSQGMTLDAAEIDLRSAFCYGMGYVALSRVRSLEGLKLLGFNEKSLQIDPKILKQDKLFKGQK